ncbi:hypothetical protein ACFWVM_28950 [Nocardia fluminea]|uniref:hypothetical protein n=1 Tax=Nocardia fluminea TaxID=134984 RepID=UPI003651B5F0
MPFTPVTMVSPAGVEVRVATAVEANNLACSGYRTKIEPKPAASIEAAAAVEPAAESVEDRKPAKPVRVPAVK